MTQPSRPTLSHPYLDALGERVLVYDGAMGTNIQRHNPTADDFGGKALEGCNDHLVLTRPDIIQSIHESFLAVGCDVVETCTFQSTPHRLREWGLEDKTRELNVQAARLARKARRDLFLRGDYEALPGGDHVTAFARTLGEECLICCVPRLTRRLSERRTRFPVGSVWGERALSVADPGSYENLLTGARVTLSSSTPLARIFQESPLALLLKVDA